MIGPNSGGKLLTAEQSVRLAMMDHAEREQLIETIVAGLRSSMRTKKLVNGGWSPYVFYSQLSPAARK